MLVLIDAPERLGVCLIDRGKSGRLYHFISEMKVFFFKKSHNRLFFPKILFIHERHREGEEETQAEGEAGALWGA